MKLEIPLLVVVVGSHGEVKKLCDLLLRLFNEPHIKVWNVFPDALSDFIVSESAELTDWLSVMLPRLLAKSGSEALASVHCKMICVLDVIRSDCTALDHSCLDKVILELQCRRYWVSHYYHYYETLMKWMLQGADLCVWCRDAFPCQLQFNIVSKYIVDQTQTANVKVCQPVTVSHSDPRLTVWLSVIGSHTASF